MSISTQPDADLTTLRDDIAVLKNDIAILVEHLRAGVSSRAQAAAARFEDGSRRLYRDASLEGERVAKAIGQQIERQPLLTVLVVIGLAYARIRLLTR